MLNGIAAHGIFRASGATFLVFADYCRASIRLAALSHLPVTYVFTHDSIGVGEDGPTHQPVETVPGLRVIPNLDVIRPADPEETVGAWVAALERTDGRILRWLVAALGELVGWMTVIKVLNSGGDMMAVFAKCLFGLAAVVMGVIIIAPELVGWAVSPIHRLLDNILLPSESEPPPVNFKLARFYTRQMRYVEACDEYLKRVLPRLQRLKTQVFEKN